MGNLQILVRFINGKGKKLEEIEFFSASEVVIGHLQQKIQEGLNKHTQCVRVVVDMAIPVEGMSYGPTDKEKTITLKPSLF
jgi:hypothetical protein